MKIDKKLLEQSRNKKEESIKITKEIVDEYLKYFLGKSNANERTKSNSKQSRTSMLKKVLVASNYFVNPQEINKAVMQFDSSNNYKNLCISVIGSLYKWLNTNMNLDLDKSKLNTYTKSPTNKQALTRQELDKISKLLKKFNNKQFEIAFLMLATNGMRLEELLSIDWNRWVDNYVYIHSLKQKQSGQQERVAYVNPYIKSLINKYGCKLTTRIVKYGFAKFNEFLKQHWPEFKKPLTPHILRHTFATLMYENQVPVETISKLLGHADTKTTTSVYIHNNPTINVNYFKMFELTPQDTLEVQSLLKENYALKQLLISKGVNPKKINKKIID